MMPARLTSSLLARKGEAKPTALDAPSNGLARPQPARDGRAGPTARRAPVVEILVPARAPTPATAGSGRPGPGDHVNLTVRIDRKLHTRLRVLAARQQRTNGDIVEGALEAYLNIFGPCCACVGGAKPKA